LLRQNATATYHWFSVLFRHRKALGKWRGLLRDPIGNAATPYDLALRRAGDCLPDSAGWSGYLRKPPSIKPGIDVTGQ
jgi:hypothetical protein